MCVYRLSFMYGVLYQQFYISYSFYYFSIFIWLKISAFFLFLSLTLTLSHIQHSHTNSKFFIFIVGGQTYIVYPYKVTYTKCKHKPAYLYCFYVDSVVKKGIHQYIPNPKVRTNTAHIKQGSNFLLYTYRERYMNAKTLFQEEKVPVKSSPIFIVIFI